MDPDIAGSPPEARHSHPPLGGRLGGVVLALALIPLSAAGQEETAPPPPAPPPGTSSGAASGVPGRAQPDERQSELEQRSLLGEQSPLQRLTSPEDFPAGRASSYVVGLPTAGPLVSRDPGGGRRLGSLAVGGYASSAIAYDSNPDGEPHGGSGEGVLATSVGVVASPTLTRHSVAFVGSVTATGTLPDVANSDVSGTLGAAGTLNLSPRSALDLDLTYARQIEAPEAADREAGTQAGNRDQISSGATYVRRYRRANLSLGVTLNTVVYEDTSADDYFEPSLNVGFGYALTPRLALQLASSLSQILYPESGPDGTDRDTRTAQATIGLGYQSGHETAAAVSIGYARDDPADGNGTNELIFAASLSGRLDENTSAGLSASRSFDPTTNVRNAAGVTVTQLAVQVQRALGRRLTAGAELAVSLDEYADINRTDLLLAPRLGLAYALTDTVSLALRYAYDHDFSDSSNAGFERHVLTAGIAVRF